MVPPFWKFILEITSTYRAKRQPCQTKLIVPQIRLFWINEIAFLYLTKYANLNKKAFLIVCINERW